MKAGSRAGSSYPNGITKFRIISETGNSEVSFKDIPAFAKEILTKAKQAGVTVPEGMELNIVTDPNRVSFLANGFYIRNSNYLELHPNNSPNPRFLLAHELGHANHWVRFPRQSAREEKKYNRTADNPAEKYATEVANLILGNSPGTKLEDIKLK